MGATANDLLLFRTEPYYYRFLPTALAKQCFEMRNRGEPCRYCQSDERGYRMRLGMLEGDFDNGYVSVDNGISQINKIKSVKELIDELASGF